MKQSRPFYKHILAALFTGCLAISSANAATILAGDSLIPAGLGAGDTFHLIFIANEDISSANTVATFNDYVDDVANNLNGQTGSIVASLGANWFLVGSEYDSAGIDTISARDNAVVTTAVYNLVGTKIADDYADMWDGTIDNPISTLKDGSDFGSNLYHTGTNTDGTVNIRSFGPDSQNSRVRRGFANLADGGWINGGDETHRSGRGVLALSEVITVVAIPEPTSALLGGLGLLTLLRRRR